MTMPSKTTRRVVVTALSAALCSLGLAVSMVARAAVGEVKVGVILPLTGDKATFGQESLNGLKLALEKAGKETPQLKIQVEDTQGTPAGSAAAVNKLIATDKVAVIIGEVASSNTIAASTAAQSAKIPLMTHASTNDTITLGKDFISRICFVDSFQGAVMAKFAVTNLKAKTAAILVDSDSDYSRGLRDSFKQAFIAAGGTIKEDLVISYSQKDRDFKTQLIKVRKAAPDAVFIPGYYTQVGAILRQAKELKLNSKFLGTDGWDSPDLFKIAGAAAAGHYVSSHFAADDTDNRVQDFVREYKARNKENPGAMAALGYDAGFFMRAAIKKAGSNEPSKIRDAIASMKNFDGITGTITIDKNRNAVKPAVIVTTTEKEFKFLTRVNP
ncbi:ABC transporter substrate-binding protein [bacterium]|nr:ABC transporter substrate-binding protein [bacterium]